MCFLIIGKPLPSNATLKVKMNICSLLMTIAQQTDHVRFFCLFYSIFHVSCITYYQISCQLLQLYLYKLESLAPEHLGAICLFLMTCKF
jgi:hypothetical protein